MIDFLTALLILSPITIPVPQHNVPKPMWDSLKRVALRVEVVGKHERWIDDYRSEVNYVRNHFWDLKNAPPLADCSRFPSDYVAKTSRNANREYRQYLANRVLSVLHDEDFKQSQLEANGLDNVYSWLETISNENQAYVNRRAALRELRNWLGEADYYAGRLPPPVPLWRFAVR